MTGELPLFAPYSDPDTSLAAARAIAPHLGRLEALVLDHIRACGPVGTCDHEGQMALGLDDNTYRPRRWGLVRRGFIKDSGLRRNTPAGRKAVVWIGVAMGGGPAQASKPQATLEGAPGTAHSEP